MTVFHIVAVVGLEVGVEAAFVFTDGKLTLPGEHVGILTGAGGEFPFGLGGEAVGLDVNAFLAERALEEVGTPVAERVGLLPAYADHGIFAVAAVAEVHAHVRLVVGVLEVVYPRSGIGVDVYDIRVEEIVVAGEGAGYGFAHDFTFVVDPGGILRNHRDVGGHGAVGVVFALARVEAVLALYGLGLVVDLVAVVELVGVELARAGDGVGAVYAFDGACLVLARITPGDRLAPVEVGCDGIALLVFLDAVVFIAAVGGVGETFADNGVAHPEDELLVFRVGDFGFVHPESVDRHPFGVGGEIPCGIGFGGWSRG